MAHAHDRTFLASLAFADPDKKDPFHDLGCQYIARPEIVNALGLIERCQTSKPWHEQPLGTPHEAHTFVDLKTFADEDDKPLIDSMLTKGQGQYITTIGFIDVIVPMCVMYNEKRQSVSPLYVEVKIKEVSLGDVLRQVNLYKQYVDLSRRNNPPSKWLVAAAFKMSTGFIEGLRSQNIDVVHLGEKFQMWVSAQRYVVPTTSVLSI